MAGQSITFDFLTTGADRTAGDFRKTGDNAALAAKGAKVLADTIEQLGKKQDRTAGESKILASALRQTGDAADRVTAKTVLADAAIRRLDDAMAEASKKPLEPQVLTGKALKALTGIQARADELKARFPEFTVQIDDKAAKAKLDLFAAESKVTLDKIDKRLSGSGSGGIGGIAARLFGGGAGSAGGAAAGAAPAAGPLLGGLGVPGGITAVAAGLAALPFAAQAAAGGITFALGGALAGLAIAGAAKTKSVQASFATLKTHASADLGTIGTSFVPVMNSILGTAGKVLGQLTPVFAGAAKAISGPFKAFGDALLKAFGQPAVKQSISDVATAFGKILTAVTPGLARDVGQIATGVSKLAGAVAANPKAFADFVGFLAATAGGALTAVASLTKVATYIEMHFVPAFVRARHDVAHWWGDLTNDLAKLFDIAANEIGISWDHIKLDALQGVKYIMDIMGHLPGPLGAPFRAAEKSIAGNMAGIEADVKRRTGQIQSDIDSIHGKTVQVGVKAGGSGGMTFTEKVAASISTAGSFTLLSKARGGMIDGGTPGKDSVLGMLMPGEVVVPTAMVNAGAVDHLRGKLPGFSSGGQARIPGYASGGLAGMVPWVSNAQTDFVRAAEADFLRKEQAHLQAAVKAAATQASTFAGAGPGGTRVPNVGSGVSRWAGLVRQALAMEHLNPNDILLVLYQMLTESGGNPDAINLTDINAQHGDPSKGLMQVIGATFARWHWPGTSFNIYDPLANIAAALNYASHGRGIGTGPGQLGSGHGYALGGLVPGYASGGTVAGLGQTFLDAWRSRKGGPYALAIGPQTLTQQIPAMQAAIGRATTLSRAGGLSAGQHKFWAGAAAGETRLLATLKKEMTTEQAWSGQLTGTDATLAREIAAAGSVPSLAGNVRAWKSQMAAHLHTIGDIRGMIGAAAAPGTPGGPVLPKITHQYGGDVANTIGAFLASVAAPFGAARGGMVWDRGGVLRPGWNPPMYNATGRPESLVPARGGGKLELVVSYDGSLARTGLSQQQLRDIRYTVKTVGGGSVDRAFGSR